MSLIRWFASIVALLALLTVAPRAYAQAIGDTGPMPNVLLLLDTSGSFEAMVDGRWPEDPSENVSTPGAACSPGVESRPNRWGITLQALTGDILPYYSCAAQSRAAGSPFALEYGIVLGGSLRPPYDVDYVLPYHRPVAPISGLPLPNGCVVGPGRLPGVSAGEGVGVPPRGAGGAATDWPDDAIGTFRIGELLASVGSLSRVECAFDQASNGLLDDYAQRVRFGLMTFDQDPRDGRGTDPSGARVLATPASPFDGMWSMFATPRQGWPAGATCGGLTPCFFELGARSRAAPPWEGRLIGFGSPNASASDVASANERIQRAILALRPYGATPLAALLDDARHFFWSDPAGPQRTDPYVSGSRPCRDQYVVILADGAPDQDLRPACEAAGGACPYPRAEEIAAALASGNDPRSGTSGHRVYTFVVGFAVSTGSPPQPVDCVGLARAGTLSSVCSDPSQQATYGACCALERIAVAGAPPCPPPPAVCTPPHAYFAASAQELREALGSIVARVIQNTTARTPPVYLPQVRYGPETAGSTAAYLSSLTPSPDRPWSGNVRRERYECAFRDGRYAVIPQPVSVAANDDFAANLNSNNPARRFLSVLADPQGAAIRSADTLRPYVSGSNPDGLGVARGVEVGLTPADIVSSLPPSALGIHAASCHDPVARRSLSASECAALALNFAMGELDTPRTSHPQFPWKSRYGNAFGGVLHSTPAVVGPPSAPTRDAAYRAFADRFRTRQTMLYTATTDGLLHAFWADPPASGGPRNNERWAFLPPAVLPRLLSAYPASATVLLDGPPVVKDVVWERRRTELGDATRWHTALVAGFGGRGYYALDVTDPEPDRYERPSPPTLPDTANKKGPHFLWQLTTVPLLDPSREVQLFGKRSATPAIATVFVDPDGGGDPREIGVAILPGGMDDPPTQKDACDRAPKPTTAAPVGGFPARAKVRRWGRDCSSGVAGRSVSIVRIDTGEILAVFGRVDPDPAKSDIPQALLRANPGRAIDTKLDSPMTGVPVVYPAEVGAIATKFFIGDADGTVWRFDISSPDPRRWKGELFLDAYNRDAAPGDDDLRAIQGEPIVVPPVLALDRVGNLVLAFATGDQETFTTTTEGRGGATIPRQNFVYSVREVPVVSGGVTELRADVSWYLPFGASTGRAGERVTGPMAMFDGVLYFATFAPASSGDACAVGEARVWGRDYTMPDPACSAGIACGGVPRLAPPCRVPPCVPPASFPPYVVPAAEDPSIAGKIIPGVSVRASQPCATTTVGVDEYTGLPHTMASNVTSASYSLFVEVGGTARALEGQTVTTYEIPLPSPVTSTIVDSWAAVIE